MPSLMRQAATWVLGCQLGLTMPPVEAQEAQEPAARSNNEPPEILGHEYVCEMSGAVHELSRSPTLHPHQIVLELEKLCGATDRYAEHLAYYDTLSAEQFREVRNVMEQTVLMPLVIQASGASGEREIFRRITRLYDVLLPKLIQARREAADNTKLTGELTRHYTHILIATQAARLEARVDLAEALFNHFGSAGEFPAFKIFQDIDSWSLRDGTCLDAVWRRHSERIRSSFIAQLEALEQPSHHECRHYDQLLTLHTSIRAALLYAEQNSTIAQTELERHKRDLDDVFVSRVVPHIITLWRNAYRENSFSRGTISSEWLYHSPLSSELICGAQNSLSRQVSDLLAAWPGDRNELGALYFDLLEPVRQEPSMRGVLGYMVLSQLPQLSPQPQRLGFLIDALRARFGDRPETEAISLAESYALLGKTLDRPAQIGRILGECLMSDYMYFSTADNTSFNPVLAHPLIVELSNDLQPLDRYHQLLTPSQIFLVELLRVAKGGASAATVGWAQETALTSHDEFVTRARHSLFVLMRDLYQLQPPHLLAAEWPREVSGLNTRSVWGMAATWKPGAERSAQWSTSMDSLYRTVDSIAEEFAKQWPRVRSVYVLAGDLSRFNYVMESRGGLFDRDHRDTQRTPCRAVEFVQRRYATPRSLDELTSLTDAETTEFEQLKRAIVEHIAALGEQATIRGAQEREAAAHHYVETLQRACLTQFAINELSARTPKPQGGVHTSAPQERQVQEILKNYGFLAREPELRTIFNFRRPSPNGVATDLDHYMQKLTEELAQQELLIKGVVPSK